ncbi:preprotein translocase subunit SecF [Sediminihabitans luteus]|uniref:Protein-export membrane protein SecF n=1 Tax=Sediminihabitans luteus TaxID=1138585 RepID=A0A2M9CQE6_9CELL|nr:protein translocase subunit SecF [Sediminihabitans luteus]PJJ74160.1 preprotein translocase subunit SecF [Sediminihabitans luteus]GII99013.1 protein-export membrane protein SecF [Sediminihabitans luteus]
MASGFAQWGNDLYTGRRSYQIVGKRRGYFVASALVVLFSVLVVGFKGFDLGIEFRGGSQFTVSQVADTSEQIALDAVAAVAPDEEPRVSVVGGSSMRVQTEELTPTEVTEVSAALAEGYGVSTDDVTSSFIGPSWGKDVSGAALRALVIFLAFVAIVMSLYFRSWRMAVSALVALFHDVVITAGLYALIGWEVTPATVIGFLTILGYSVYDTVVVFDKVRENTHGVLDQTRSTYAEKANLAVNQTLIRSINTSIVALLPVGSILFIGAFVLGAGTLRDISLALFIGIAVGAYSSIFLATPLEVALREREPKIKAHTDKVLTARRERAEQAGADEADAVLAAAGVEGAAQLVPGSHQGNRAQPRRKRR